MKLSMLSIVVGLSATMTSGHAFAQANKNQSDLAGMTGAKSQGALIGLSDAPPVGIDVTSRGNSYAIKDFKARFGNAKDELWYAIDKGSLAYFSLDGHHVRAYYNRKGRWMASLIYADEHKLPASLRDLVRRAYYDLPITFVEVIETPDHVSYLVQVQDATTLKILRVSEEGEIDVMNEFTKL